MPTILAHSPELVVIPFTLFLLPLAIAFGIVLPPQLLLRYPPQRRAAGLPALPTGMRWWRRFIIASTLILNLVGFLCYYGFAWVFSLSFSGKDNGSAFLLLLLLFAAAEALSFYLRWRLLRRRALSRP